MAALFGFFVYSTKELQVHPMRLIMYLAFVESIFQITLLLSERICQFRVNELLSWTIYFSNDPYDVAKATMLLANCCNFFSLGFMSLSISLNTCLCLDLILMVRYPFGKKESRVPWYLTISCIIAFAEALFLLSWSGIYLMIGGYMQIA